MGHQHACLLPNHRSPETSRLSSHCHGFLPWWRMSPYKPSTTVSTQAASARYFLTWRREGTDSALRVCICRPPKVNTRPLSVGLLWCHCFRLNNWIYRAILSARQHSIRHLSNITLHSLNKLSYVILIHDWITLELCHSYISGISVIWIRMPPPYILMLSHLGVSLFEKD